MPILDDLNLEKQIATVPDNTTQPPRFGGITELTKDAFVLELRHFLSTKYTGLRAGELPRVEKYAVAIDVDIDPLETAVSLIRSYPDIEEDMPILAVLATTGQNRKLSISDNFTSLTVNSAKLVGTVANGPFNLSDGMTITITTQPNGIQTNLDGTSAIVASTFVFHSFMFTDITHATLDEVIYAINFQALYASAYATSPDSSGNSFLALRAGGLQGTSFPNQITITGGTALTALGFTIGATDQNFGASKQAFERHHMAADLTVAIEVIAESENVRTELTDLLYDFVTFVMADRKYQFYGRSVFDSSILDETYQIIIKDNEIAFAGETETPRAGDPRDKIYINRITVPVTSIMYSDRVITDRKGGIVTPLINIGLISDDSLPEPN